MRYQELKEGIESRLNSAAEDFFTIGFYLRQISENALFIEDGYKNIWEFAKGEYGLSTASASRFMAINSKFSIDGGQTMEQRYIGMGVSKLQEMLTLPEEDLEKVTKETTVKEIRAMKAAKNTPLSFFGWPVTKRPEGSLLTTKGCSEDGSGKGGHDCFSCCRDCAIRQEERMCYTAPVGNPHPCSFTKENREEVEKHSIHGSKCLHIHPELAPKRAGDGEPEPCCLLCEEWKSHSCNMLCCDVAKRENEKKKKEQEKEWARQAAERQKAERERKKAEEAAKRSITETEWRALYEWLGADEMEEITSAALKDKNGKSSHGGTVNMPGGHYGMANCSMRGIRIASGGSQSKEETWATAARILRDIQREELLKHPKKEKDPEIIDADFQEVDETPEEMTGARAAFEKARAKVEAQKAEEAAQEVLDPDPEDAWKVYTVSDVADILNKTKFDLEQFEAAGGLPERTLRKQKIMADALQMLYDEMKRREAEEDDEAED